MIRYRSAIIIFSPDKGGRSFMPVDSGYSPHACTPNGQEHLPIILHDIPSSAHFNAEFEATIEFRYPDRLDYSALVSGQEFDLVEGAKRIGHARLLILEKANSGKPIDPRDNMSAGACIGNTCRRLPHGARIRINVGD